MRSYSTATATRCSPTSKTTWFFAWIGKALYTCSQAMASTDRPETGEMRRTLLLRALGELRLTSRGMSTCQSPAGFDVSLQTASFQLTLEMANSATQVMVVQQLLLRLACQGNSR